MLWTDIASLRNAKAVSLGRAGTRERCGDHRWLATPMNSVFQDLAASVRYDGSMDPRADAPESRLRTERVGPAMISPAIPSRGVDLLEATHVECQPRQSFSWDGFVEPQRGAFCSRGRGCACQSQTLRLTRLNHLTQDSFPELEPSEGFRHTKPRRVEAALAVSKMALGLAAYGIGVVEETFCD